MNTKGGFVVTYGDVAFWVLGWLGPVLATGGSGIAATVELILCHLHPESAPKWVAAVLLRAGSVM